MATRSAGEGLGEHDHPRPQASDCGAKDAAQTALMTSCTRVHAATRSGSRPPRRRRCRHAGHFMHPRVVGSGRRLGAVPDDGGHGIRPFTGNRLWGRWPATVGGPGRAGPGRRGVVQVFVDGRPSIAVQQMSSVADACRSAGAERAACRASTCASGHMADSRSYCGPAGPVERC